MYEYIYGCICVGLSVCSWMGGQRGDLIPGIFEAVPECLEDLPLSIFGARTTQRAVPAKICETGRENEGRSQLGGRLRSRVRNSNPGRGASQSALRRQSRALRGRYVFENGTSSGEDDDQRRVSIFSSCVGFSHTSRDSHEHT